MFNKKKINFWRLAFIFTGITIFTLVFLWSSPYKPKETSVNVNMSNMMTDEHLSNTAIKDLFKNEDQQNEMDDMISHHQNQSNFIFKLNFFTTAVIFLLLPLIIGGSIILFIIWIK